ncbi:MAG: inorganic phosphate transporter [Chitinophagales bacterium]|nr:inorganic phosphate transporter [Chitinophagales bacterium]
MTLLIIIISLALIFDYINGFHDAANSIATIVSTKVLTPFQAVVWAATFNFAAYFIFTEHGVANTIAKTVIQDYITLPVILAGIMAAIIWNLLTWWFGIPSSSSHTLIGGFAGAAIAHAGFMSIKTEIILKVASFIFLAPIIGMVVAFIIALWFLNSFKKGAIPKLVSVGIIVLAVTALSNMIETQHPKILGISDYEIVNDGVILKDVTNGSVAHNMGLRKEDFLQKIDDHTVTNEMEFDHLWKVHKKGDPIAFSVIRKNEPIALNTIYQPRFASDYWNILFYSKNIKWLILGSIICIMAVFTLFMSYLNYAQSERWFKRMQLVSSAAFSVGHGGNDAQKVMGIIMAAYIAYDPQNYSLDHMVWWVPLACYGAIAIGTLSGGWKIIKTMGTKITKVTPFEGVAAETAGALTLFVTEFLKIPVSTTHTITGSIIGVGATKRLSAVRWGVTVNLVWAWILTIPVSGLLAMIIYNISSLLGLR